MNNKTNENEINTKKTLPMLKYRCEECQGILFMSSKKIPETVIIEIVCKTKHFNNKSSRNKTRCNHLNVIKGSK